MLMMMVMMMNKQNSERSHVFWSTLYNVLKCMQQYVEWNGDADTT